LLSNIPPTDQGFSRLLDSMLSQNPDFAYNLTCANIRHQRPRPNMNLVSIVCAGVLLLAGGAAAQDGGKAIQKTSISLGTARLAAAFRFTATPLRKP